MIDHYQQSIFDGTEQSIYNQSIELIKTFEEVALQRNPVGYVVGYSGGKDSDVLVDLFRKSGVKFADTYCKAMLKASALISEGIGDVKEAKFEADHYWRMWQGALVELERAEHHAQVAENELKLYKLAVKIWQERYSDIRCFNFNIALRQAEKELAEEGKDD